MKKINLLILVFLFVMFQSNAQTVTVSMIGGNPDNCTGNSITGAYTLSSVINGKNSYVKGIHTIKWTGTKWAMDESGFEIYYNNTSTPLNPPCGTWFGTFGCFQIDLTGNCTAACINPTIPSVTSNLTTVCLGNTATLNISGTLNDATQWSVYTGSCGGTLLGTTTSSSFVVTPSGTSTTYYVRGEGGCITPGSCGSVTVNVSNISLTPSSQTNIACNGGSNGAAAVNAATGGAGGYTYNWTPGNPTGDGTTSVTGLAAGIWTCTVTDVAGCTKATNFTVTQPTALSLTPSSQTNIACNGGSTGAAAVNAATGGAGGYSYNWTPGNPTGDGTTSVTGLTAGTWTCTVTDANSCTASYNFNVAQPTALLLTPVSQTNIACNGGSTGAAAVNTATGGAGGYSYNWTPGNPTGDGTTSVSGLTAGIWTCTVTDANSCTAATNYTITQPTTALTGSQTLVECAGFSVTVGSNTYTTTGIYTDVLTGSNGCDSTVTTDLTIINISDQTVTAVQNAFCNNGSTTIDLGSSEIGFDYYLRNDSDNSIVDGPIAGTGSGLSLNTGSINATTTYNVYAANYSPVTTNSLEFTGNTGLKKVSLGTNLWTDNFVGTNQLTVEAWVKRASTGSLHTIIGNYDGSYPFLFRIDNDKIVLYMNSVSSVTSSSTIPVGVWTHLAGTYDGTNLKVYINGVLEGTTAYTGNFIATTNEIKIGGGLSNNTEYFLGDIADVRLWTVAKTQSEIAAGKDFVLNGNEANLIANYQFTEGSGTTTANSATGNAYPGTLVNNPAWVVGPTLTGVTCDLEMSTLVTVTINQPTTGSQTFVECAGFSVTVGTNTYNTTGVYTDVLVGSNGCDSTVTTDLTINQPTTGSQTFVECAGFSVTVGTNTYNTTGVYTDVLVGANGCDSTVTTDLTIKQPTTSSQTLVECAGFSVTVGTNTYNTTGVYTDVLVGSNGCDSTVTTDLTIKQPTTSSQTLVECAGFSITVGTNTYSTTGVYTDVLVRANGCDSTVTTDLTINTIDLVVTNTSPTLTANQSGATYQWLDCDNGNAIIPSETAQTFTATANGNYAVEVTLNGCVDTSACENITGVGINETANNVVSIYPNPTNGMVNINLGSNNSTVDYTISSIEGRLIETGKTSTNNITVDLSKEGNGVYFVKINTENTSTVYKLIKQ